MRENGFFFLCRYRIYDFTRIVNGQPVRMCERTGNDCDRKGHKCSCGSGCEFCEFIGECKKVGE